MQQSIFKKLTFKLQHNTTRYICWSKYTYKKASEKGVEFATRTCRGNSKHQAYVWVVYDVCIIGTETIYILDRKHILENQHQLSAKHMKSSMMERN